MAINENPSTLATNQVTTSFNGPPTVSDPAPAGTTTAAGRAKESPTPDGASQGHGIDGEEVVWEARYSMKNFLGRLIAMTLLTVAWAASAVATWGYRYENLALLTVIGGIVLGLFWLGLLYRIVQARYGHYYRLTTRRLFVSTGLMRRRRDMMELIRVKDVFMRQTLIERWLSLGTVVVVSSDRELPTFYAAGVDDPKRVMDLIWHHARSERDHLSVKVDEV